MRVQNRFQRRFPNVIHRISKRLPSVTPSDQRGPKFLEDLFSKVTVRILSKSQRFSRVLRWTIACSSWSPGLRYTSDYSIWAGSRSNVIWIHFILRGSLLSHFRQQFYVRGSYPFIWTCCCCCFFQNKLHSKSRSIYKRPIFIKNIAVSMQRDGSSCLEYNW